MTEINYNQFDEEFDNVFITVEPINVAKKEDSYAMELTHDEAYELYFQLKESLIYK